MSKTKKMTCCPHCGSTDGLYSKETAKYHQYYTLDGTPNGYSDHDYLLHRGQTVLYCIACDKKVTTLEKLEENKQADTDKAGKE